VKAVCRISLPVRAARLDCQELQGMRFILFGAAALRRTEPFLYTQVDCFCLAHAFLVQGVQDKIKIVAIDLADRPAWYKEKVYPGNKVWLISNSVSLEQSITLFQ
jgi:hypothetical protein